MANGDVMPKIPGFQAAWGVSLSNTAIVVGGLALLGLTWLTLNRRSSPALDDESQAQSIENDVLAYAANENSVGANRDRIRAAINRIRDQFRIARENYHKKLKDLIIARKAGTITNTQFQTQHRLALGEFHTALKNRHLEIMHELGIPKYDASLASVTPTLV